MQPPQSKYDNWWRTAVLVGLGSMITYAVVQNQTPKINTVRELVPAVARCSCGATCKCCPCASRELVPVEE